MTDPKKSAVPPVQEATARSKASHKQILTELRSHPCRLIVLGCIVNPMGPTLISVLMLSEKRGSNWNLYRLSLNPFGQALTRLRTAELKEATSPSSIIRELGLGIDGAPTILFFGEASSDEIDASVRQIALASNNFTSTVDRLRRFPGNPWDRISEEMKNAFGAKAGPDRKATDQDVQDYFSMIFDEKNLEQEIAAFNRSWVGSIKFQLSNGSFLAKTAMPLSDLRVAMSILLESKGEEEDDA